MLPKNQGGKLFRFYNLMLLKGLLNNLSKITLTNVFNQGELKYFRLCACFTLDNANQVINTPEFQWLNRCKFVFCSHVTVLCRCSWLAGLWLSSMWRLRDPHSLTSMALAFFRALEPCMLLTGHFLRTTRLKVTNICPHMTGENLSQSLI